VRAPHAVRPIAGLLAAAAIVAGAPGGALAAQHAKLKVSFTPYRLGRETTIRFGFHLAVPPGTVPSALTNIDLSYPAGLGFALSELGIATCSASTLEAYGPAGCSQNSLMGYGSALAEIQVGPEILHETVQVTIVRSATLEGHIALLVYAEGETPVNAQLVFPGLLLPAAKPYGGRLAIGVPLVPSLPEAPDVAVVQFHSTIGPLHLHYQEHVHGRTVTFKPRGIPLPAKCPHKGFRFAAKFTFLDATTAYAHATVPCPHARARRGRLAASGRVERAA
jgi:hypothetical protein